MPLPRPGRDEIGRLTAAFHVMRERLQTLIGALEMRTSELSLANG